MTVTEQETGRKLEVTGLSSLNNSVIAGKITVGEELDLTRSYTVQIEGYDAITAVPTGVFDSAAFAEKYNYDGDSYAETTGDTTEVYLLPGDENQYKSNDGGVTLYQEKKMTMAGIVELNQIQPITPTRSQRLSGNRKRWIPTPAQPV